MTAAPEESPPPAPTSRQDGDGKGPFTVFDPDGPFRAFQGDGHNGRGAGRC